MFGKLWNQVKQEPVRAHLYTLILMVLGFLYLKHYLDTVEVSYLGGMVAAILGVENLRSKVSPVGSADTAPTEKPPIV